MFREHFLTLAEPDSWNKYLPADRSVFGSHGYARICAAFRNFTPRLFVAELGEATICYPILLRSLWDLPFSAGTEGRWDATTPDFTGPLMAGSEPELVRAFSVRRDEVFRQEGIVAEFGHLHPWADFTHLLPEGLAYNREIVWVDTSLSPDELWNSHIDHSCRKNIKRSQQESVRIVEGSSDEYIAEFYRIYSRTMERNQARPEYYFSLEFFKAFRDELPENSRFVFAEYRDRIVAATLYLHDDNDVFSFLGGADADFQQVRPSNLLIWETVRWAHHAGKKRFALGGGYKPDDGIFRFKSTFSPLRQSFYVYKRIHHQQDYGLLDRRWREHHAGNGDSVGYFPSYRA